MSAINQLRWSDRLAAVGLAAATVAVLLATCDIGFTRDEGFYFRAAFAYLEWLKLLVHGALDFDLSTALSQEAIDRHMGFNQEHPVLPKLLFAGSYWLFHEGLGWVRPSTAMRLPGILSWGLLIYLVYTFTVEAYGRKAAAIACIALVAMPRPFFHAHMACFDAMVVTTWFWVTIAWWRSLRSRRWALAAGVIFGLALSVKHNAFFLPAVLGTHWIILGALRARALTGRPLRERLPRFPLAFVSMALLGPAVWMLLWPNHWFDTFARIKWYMTFHLEHVHYFQYFFGQNLYAPPFPFHFPFTMTAVTVPPLTLLAGLLGATVLMSRWWATRRGTSSDDLGTGWLMGLGLLVPILVIAMPSTPIFGGVKHWMPAMPFLTIFAGVGVSAAGTALGAELARRTSWGHQVSGAVPVALAALVLAPAITSTAHSHPNGTAHYNVLVGGVRGAADREMMRQFWGYAGGDAVEYINQEAPRGRIFFQNTTHDAYRMYQRDGSLESTVRYGSLGNSDYGMIHHQMAFRPLEAKLWRQYGTRNPVFVSHHDGVPVLRLYQNQKRKVRQSR